MPKIIFVNRYFYPDLSAISQMVSDLAFALAEGGESVWAVTSRQRYENPQERLPSREWVRGVEVHRTWTTRFGRPSLPGRMLDYASFYFSAFATLLRLVRRGDTIVAKTDPPLISVVVWVAARIRGALLVNWLQDLFPEVAMGIGVLPARRWTTPLIHLRNFSLKVAKVNVVLGERMQRRLIEHGLAPERIRINSELDRWSTNSTGAPPHKCNAPRLGIVRQVRSGVLGKPRART